MFTLDFLGEHIMFSLEFWAEWNNPDHSLRGTLTWNLMWDSYVGILCGTLMWDSYVESYVGLLRGQAVVGIVPFCRIL